MNVQTFHRYNKIVRRGYAKPLTCEDCGHEFVVRATEDGDPVLQCFTCPRLVQPGLRLYTDILAVVKEHFDD